MLAAYCSSNNQTSQQSCSVLIGSKGSNGGLISENTSLLSSDSGSLDTCSFFSEPSDAAILAFCEGSETCGTVAYNGETAGSIAYGGGETAGSIACSSGGSGFSGGGCSFSC